MAQNIASAIDSDDFNSISDTVEAYQIAQVIEETYYEVLAAIDVPSKDSLILLTGLGDVSHPNYLKIPDSAKIIEWFKYDYQSLGVPGDYVTIQYLEPDAFITQTVANAGQSNSPPFTQITDFSGAVINILNTQEPTYWTTFDNTYVVTDSWDSAKDDTLQQSRSLSWGQNNLQFVVADAFVIPIDDDLLPLLLAEAKSTCFNNIKQTAAPKEEQRAHRQLIRVQNDFWRANQRKPYDRTPNFGRRRLGVNPLSNTRNPTS